MKAISDVLIHFLGRSYRNEHSKQLEMFFNIIANGLKCSKISTKYHGGGALYNQGICFTDIPLSMCDEHTSVYGKFAIGFKKSWVKERGGNPAHYLVDYEPAFTQDSNVVENRGVIFSNACQIFNHLFDLIQKINSDDFDGFFDKNGKRIYKKENIKEITDYLHQMMSLQKPTGDLGPARDDTDQIDQYYKEREWRIVPCAGSIISGRAIVSSEEDIYFNFERRDVQVIIVPSSDMRKAIANWISENREHDKVKDYFADTPPILIYDEIKNLY